MGYQHIAVPVIGEKISVNDDFSINVPDRPIIPYIEGDGIGVDITPVMLKVVDAAVAKAYAGVRQISWMEIYTGEKAAELYDGDWFPAETLQAIREFVVAIKGPLTTPVGGGFRSLNVALRQELDLYVCLRPVRWFEGVPSPVKEPFKTNMVIFRENSEDIYAGIEWKAGSAEADKVIAFLQDEMGVTKIRFPEQCGIGIKPVSEAGSKRLVRRAIQYAIDQQLPSVTLVHKGNIMKFTEGSFKEWGYQLAREEFGGELLDGGPWVKLKTRTPARTSSSRTSSPMPCSSRCCCGLMNTASSRRSTSMVTISRMRWPRRSAASALHPAPTSATMLPCSKPPMAPRRSMRGRIRSTPDR